MVPRRALLATLLVILSRLVGPGYSSAADFVTFPKSSLEVVSGGKKHAFEVELATRPDQLSQGLMYRRSLGANAGMLFDFGQTRPVSMWMRNTLIPLDMLFIDDQGRVVAVVERAVPGSEEPRGPPVPVRAVLELNGGTASRLGIGPGATVRHATFGNR